MDYRALALIGLLVLFAGCTLKANNPEGDMNGGVIVAQQPDRNAQIVPRPLPPYNWQEPFRGSQPASPIVCNDGSIVRSLIDKLGPEYSVTKAALPFGKSTNFVSCALRNGGNTLLTYSILEQGSEGIAIQNVEDEKKQYMGQISNYRVEDGVVGENSYLFIQLVDGGELYRLAFVDDSRQNAVVFIRATRIIPKELVLDVAKTLQGII